MEVPDWDYRWLLVCFIITAGMQLTGWAIAVLTSSEKLYDFAGGANFILVALLTLCLGDEYSTRQVVATVLMCTSRAVLAGFLLFRVLARGGDARFDGAKESPGVMLVFWSLQIVWVYVVVSPVIFINGSMDQPELCALDYIGFVLTASGIVLQLIADVQKYRFRNDERNKGCVCDVGLWYVSRHPNYFGEVIIWWGLFITGCSVFSDDYVGYVSVASPLVTMTLLLCVSGIPLAEGKHLKRFYKTEQSGKAYDAYFERTSPLIPCAPACYEALPAVVKQIFCFELPSYRYQRQPSDDAETVMGGGPYQGCTTSARPEASSLSAVLSQ